MPLALPAVTVPPSFLKAGRRPASASAEVCLGCSSVSKLTTPLRVLIWIGTICSLKRPSAMASAARFWLSSAKASCSSRPIWYSAATFSAVTPMCPVPIGSVSAPTIMSSACWSPILAPWRMDGMMKGPRLMLSAPPARAKSASPSISDCAAEAMACAPDPQSRFTFIAGVVSGIPAFSIATRDRYMSRGSVLMT